MESKDQTVTTCPGCGARLDPAEADRARGYITCRYCRAKVRLKRDDGGVPGGLPFTGRRRRPGRPLMTFMALAVAGVALISVMIFFMSARILRKKADGPDRISGDTVRITAETQSAFPITCRGEKSIAIINQTFTKDGTVLVSEGPCRVFIDNTTLVSKGLLLKIRGKGTVTIENSNLTGGSCAVLASEGVSVALSNSNINSDTTAVHATGNATVTIVDCNITGPVAAMTGEKGKIVLVNTTVKGETRGNIEVR